MDERARQRIAIIGSGAMGSLFAAFLQPHAVLTMLSHWPEQIQKVSSDGLVCQHDDTSTTLHKFAITSNPRELQPLQVALVLVKSYQTARAAYELAPILEADSLVITLQNGLGNLQLLEAALGYGRVAQGVTAQGATMRNAGVVRHAGHGPTYIAQQPGKVQAIEDLIMLLNQAGLRAEATSDLRSLKWGKLVVNAGINALTAILRVPNGFLETNEVAKKIMCAASEEAATVAAELGILLPYPDASQHVAAVAQATAANLSSMLQDIVRGAPTEINAINGAVAEQGRLVGIATPVNDALWRQVTAIESQKEIDPAPKRDELLEKLAYEVLV